MIVFFIFLTFHFMIGRAFLSLVIEKIYYIVFQSINIESKLSRQNTNSKKILFLQ